MVKQALENVEKDISEDQKKAFETKMLQEKLPQNQLKLKEREEQRERDKKARDEQRAKERKEQEEQRVQKAEEEAKEQERLSFRKVTGNASLSAMRVL